MSGVVVRDAAVEDAAAIAAVQIAAWRAAYVGVMTAGYLAGLDHGEFAANWHDTLTAMATGCDPTVGADGGTPKPQVGADAVCAGGPPPEAGTILPDAVLVGEVDGRIVAIGSVGRFRRRSGDDDPSGELWMLNADPAVFGTGAGSAVHEAAIARLAGAGHRNAVLWVVRDNPRARRFYEREGWHADGNEVVADMGGTAVTELRYTRSIPDA